MIPRAITGLGVVSTVGIGRDAFILAMRAGDATRPEGPITSFDASKYDSPQIAEVQRFEPTRYLGEKGLRTLDRLTKLLIVSARLALHDAGLKKDNAYVGSTPDRVGICCSNAYGSLEAITELDRVAVLEDARYINPAKFPNTVSNSASGYASIWEDLRALNVAVSDGNCGALDAFACADIYLETGRADAILVGGAEAMSEALFLAFQKLGALGGASGNGKGVTRIGEGAALMSLELADVARARGATVRAEVIGYGTAFLPPDSEALLIHASEEAMQRAIGSAIADSGLSPKDIDVVASGISGLSRFDEKELAAISTVLGPGACIAAPKAVLGETLGAGGAMAIATTLAWFSGAKPVPLRGELPPKIDTVLVTSLGFYGNASALVVRR